MDAEILDAVTEWGTRSVADGVGGLYELADEAFSGAITDGTAWAFVLNGRFVGVFDGTIEDFEDASLTAHTAPEMALPLLYAMQARGGDVRGQYYSNDTPLTEIDDTLSSGNFVGYVELSENVLSGDYYVVYYGGRALPVAYVGNNRRLLAGDEAFERAADEVGIYSVVDADIEVVDLPERPAGVVASEPDATTADEPDATTADEPDATTADEPDATTADEPDATTADEPDAPTTEEPATGAGAPTSNPAAGDDFSSLGELSGVDDDVTTDAETAGVTAAASETPSESDGGAASDGTASPTASDTPTDDEGPNATDTSTDDVLIDDAADATEASTTDAADELDRLRRELEAARETKAELAAERDRIASERDDLRAEVDRLRDRVASLEAEIDRLENEADAADAPPERELDPDEALSGTNLFVRYEDKTAGTLERAAKGRVSPAELRENLRLDYHTDFEAAGVTVDGQPFEAFLRETPERRFAEWLLSEVTDEIRRTDTRADVSKLYEAIENVDRIDLDGAVDVTVEDTEGETDRTTVTFEVVFRNKMGAPLFAAAFDDTREPTRAETIRSLLDGARSVSRTVEPFAAAFVVTTSFFDADAMEAAVDATRGGLFSRSSRRSYVKLSRKSGFHLCLVEARDEDFFLSVPEL